LTIRTDEFLGMTNFFYTTSSHKLKNKDSSFLSNYNQTGPPTVLQDREESTLTGKEFFMSYLCLGLGKQTLKHYSCFRHCTVL